MAHATGRTDNELTIRDPEIEVMMIREVFFSGKTKTEIRDAERDNCDSYN